MRSLSASSCSTSRDARATEWSSAFSGSSISMAFDSWLSTSTGESADFAATLSSLSASAAATSDSAPSAGSTASAPASSPDSETGSVASAPSSALSADTSAVVSSDSVSVSSGLSTDEAAGFTSSDAATALLFSTASSSESSSSATATSSDFLILEISIPTRLARPPGVSASSSDISAMTSSSLACCAF